MSGARSEPKFMKRYTKSVAVRGASKYAKSKIDNPQLYRAAKAASWLKAYEKLAAVINENLKDEVKRENPAFNSKLEEVNYLIRESAKHIHRAFLADKYRDIDMHMSRANNVLVRLEETFPDFVRKAKDLHLIDRYKGKKVKSSKIEDLLHMIEKSEVFPYFIEGESHQPLIRQMAEVANISVSRETAEIAHKREKSDTLTVTEVPLDASQSILSPKLMRRYKERTGLNSWLKGSRGAQYGLADEAGLYRFAKKTAEVRAFGVVLEQLESVEDTEIRERVEQVKQKVSEFFHEAKVIIDKEGFDGEEIARNDSKKFDSYLLSMEREVQMIHELAKKRGLSLPVKSQGSIYDLSSKNPLDVVHKVASKEVFPLFLDSMGSIKAFNRVKLDTLIVGEALRRPLVQREESTSRSHDPVLREVESRSVRQASEGVVDGESVLEVEEAIDLAATGIFQHVSLSAVDIDNLVHKDLRNLTIFSGSTPKEVEKFKKKSTKFAADLRKIHKEIMDFASSDEFLDLCKAESSQVHRKAKEIVDGVMVKWAVENLGRDLSELERKRIEQGIVASVKAFADHKNKLKDQTLAKKVARYSGAVGAFLTNIVWAVTIVGPAAYTVKRAVRGEKITPSKIKKAVVPDLMMSFYDPTTKSRKKIMNDIDLRMIRSIRQKEMGKLYDLGGGVLGRDVMKYQGSRKSRGKTR